MNPPSDSPFPGASIQAEHSRILAGGDSLRTAQIPVVTAGFSPNFMEPSPDESQSEGLRQACFWIALRQELHAAFLNQRKIEFPLSRFDSFRSYSPASDSTWAGRVIILHADVLERCYENIGAGSTLETQHERWNALKDQVNSLEAALPMSFAPIHYQPSPSHQPGVLPRPFPEIWYLSHCHVTAAAYMELTKILLASSAAAGLRLGAGGRAQQREAVRRIRDSTLKLCGMALCNEYAPPIYAYACAAVALCGEYFDNNTDITEQEALLWFLAECENHLACSTSALADKLRAAWADA
ncbi:hypothetical protein KCU88_g6579, partial [Aureobasidium melanogenum]